MIEKLLNKKISRYKWYPVFDSAMNKLTVKSGSRISDDLNPNRFKLFINFEGIYLSADTEELASDILSKILSKYNHKAQDYISNLELMNEIVNNFN